jgi:hypothetical protein
LELEVMAGWPSRLLLIAMTLPLAAIIGCGGGPSDHAFWVDGRSPDELQPEIVVGDTDWKSGKKLVSYEILTASEKSDGSNLHVKVVREIQEEKGSPRKSEKTYIIGTSPVVTIFPQ